MDIISKINYDLEYVQNYSLLQDIKIFFLTIKTVLSKEGADAGKNTIQTKLETLKTQELKVSDIKELDKKRSQQESYQNG